MMCAGMLAHQVESHVNVRKLVPGIQTSHQKWKYQNPEISRDFNVLEDQGLLFALDGPCIFHQQGAVLLLSAGRQAHWLLFRKTRHGTTACNLQ